MSPMDSPVPVVDPLAARPVSPTCGYRGWEPLAVAALLVLALIARRPDYLRSHSFWVDEGWVANSARTPLGQLQLLTSSTPIGSTLLRVVLPVGGPQYLRLLPLVFAVASVLPGWSLGRPLDRAAPLYAYAVAARLVHYDRVARCSDAASFDDAHGQVRPRPRRVRVVAVPGTAEQGARWIARLSKLGASAQTPVPGLVLAAFRAGRP